MIHSKESLVSMESIKKGQMTSCNDIQQLLPEDVIIDILLRLPVKSVIRARTVCKNWYTLTKNPSFVSKHFNHHTNSGRLFVNHFDNISKKYFFSLFPDETLAGSPPVYEDVVVDMPHYLAVSLYNGVLCLLNESDRFGLSNRFALWNPATREFRALPVLALNFPPNVVIFRETFGFGLDPITNDYKVVWMWDTVDDITKRSSGAYLAAVYTLSTDSWRYLDVALTYLRIDTPLSNTCINGVYYWFCARHTGDHGVILSFDMGDELFHELCDIPNSKPGYCPLLTPYNNSLVLIDLIDFDYGPVLDIWVLMEEGCWTKQFAVPLLSEYKVPLGFWKNGQLFMEKSDLCQVALYDPETREIKDLGSRILAEPLVYRENLVAIKGKNGFVELDQLSDVDQVLNFSK